MAFHTIRFEHSGLLDFSRLISILAPETIIGSLWSQDVFTLSNILVSVTIILPAAGAALAGIRGHREYLRNAERYRHMVRHLSAISDQIKQAENAENLAILLEEANEMMLGENQDWRAVILFQKLRAPP